MLGQYLKKNQLKNTQYTADIIRLEWNMNATAKNTGIIGSTNGYIYINEAVQDNTMNITSESSIPMYDITSRYHTSHYKNLNIFFDLTLGDIIDDSIVGEQIIYH